MRTNKFYLIKNQPKYISNLKISGLILKSSIFELFLLNKCVKIIFKIIDKRCQIVKLVILIGQLSSQKDS
ncbi:hypothetical protein KIMC2_04790 [Xylocopilactobacillus apis]|uniref:Uncharacterized protein n=1 Tax=Xylocopilactobacillus apis TaxID=2932183 RepID=A0AAU9DGQ8_9LACO|nr:hypothetical protein KIMC2_04790 [Xylocopilactobacillus apis]